MIFPLYTNYINPISCCLKCPEKPREITRTALIFLPFRVFRPFGCESTSAMAAMVDTGPDESTNPMDYPLVN